MSLSIVDRFRGTLTGMMDRRHLVRLWLRNEELGWKIPEYLSPNWQRLYYGLTADPETQKFPLEPEIRSFSKGAKY